MDKEGFVSKKADSIEAVWKKETNNSNLQVSQDIYAITLDQNV